MEFEWHDAKNEENVRKHGIDFVWAIRVFDDPHMIARGIVKDVEHPRLGKMRAVRNPVNSP